MALREDVSASLLINSLSETTVTFSSPSNYTTWWETTLDQIKQPVNRWSVSSAFADNQKGENGL